MWEEEEKEKNHGEKSSLAREKVDSIGWIPTAADERSIRRPITTRISSSRPSSFIKDLAKTAQHTVPNKVV